MELILGWIISYFVGLAANLRTDAIIKSREEKLREQLGREDVLRKAFASTRPLRDDLRVACVELARDLDRRGIPNQEKPIWRLLIDDAFQADLLDWLRAGGIEEGNEVKERLRQKSPPLYFLEHQNR
ncbi:MAG: hypothetical protein HQK59_07425 [Deltaproteobacteria bacterium]|nr:hypothetical protein [Deltaproteobacteria bacterium]